MDIKDLGFDEWFEQHQHGKGLGEQSVARVTEVDRDSYRVTDGTRSVPAVLAGRFMYMAESSEDIPCVGDWVVVQFYDDGSQAIIHDLLPRKTVLRRKSSGKRIESQLIAANIDVAFIVQSCDADFSVRRLERYLAMAKDGNIESVLLLTKRDLVTAFDLERKTERIGQSIRNLEVIAVSKVTGEGLEDFRHKLEKGKTYCLLGSSGVGKTTLLNQLLGRDEYATGASREKDGKGRHTTSRRQLVVLENSALFIDTPGMRELGMIGMQTGLEQSFADIAGLAKACRYRDCTHTAEPGCAVCHALSTGELPQERYDSYNKLVRESEFHQRSYIEKRRRDKEFGKYVKSVLKHHRKQ